jgi:hypothetical protein
VGGLFTALKAGMMLIVMSFSSYPINGQFANKLYTWIKPDSWRKDKDLIEDNKGNPILDSQGKK